MIRTLIRRHRKRSFRTSLRPERKDSHRRPNGVESFRAFAVGGRAGKSRPPAVQRTGAYRVRSAEAPNGLAAAFSRLPKGEQERVVSSLKERLPVVQIRGRWL